MLYIIWAVVDLPFVPVTTNRSESLAKFLTAHLIAKALADSILDVIIIGKPSFSAVLIAFPLGF
jgi:hypothetical protein